MNIKCPACGANHNCLRLCAMVDLKIYLTEDGDTGKLDLIGWDADDIKENIVEQDMEVKCNACGKYFSANFNDEGYIDIGYEIG